MKATEESSMAIVNVDGSYSVSSVRNDTAEFTVSVRDKPPAHYLLRVESFSLLSQVLQKTTERRYESQAFKAGGYKWKLALHPVDEDKDGYRYISLYLMIVETDTLPLGWMVDVNFKLFVYDQIRDNYYTFEDSNAKARRFHAMKTEWGFSGLLWHTDFMNASKGYLVGDSCVFGAEVYVENENYSGNGECLSMLKAEDEGITWKIDYFSSLEEEVINSRTFTAGGQKWSLSLYPKGDSRTDENLSLYLNLNDANSIPPEQKVCAQYTILVKNQVNDKHCSRTAADWFFSSTRTWGYSNFMLLTDLKDRSKGFLMNDTLIIEVKVDVTSSVKKLA